MKPIFFIFLFILFFSVNNVSSLGFSPENLVYNLYQNSEECKTISITSQSEEILVSDKWAENKDVVWKTSLFDKNANYHGILIDYDKELSIEEREIEVCLSGENIGEYHGVVLVREGKEGNSVVQTGIWLKVTITEKPEEIPEVQQTNTNTGGNNGGSSGGGSSGGGIITKANITNSSENNNESETIKLFAAENEAKNSTEDNGSSQNRITGAVVGEKGIHNWGTLLAIFLIIILAIILFTYAKRRKSA